mmetsp:Transcript_4912/g.11823  ORF Transcript_4912/g.11823 Transcript_4912/m.11823 type:complete len:145 (+) Transcript_4912:125-559(+)
MENYRKPERMTARQRAMVGVDGGSFPEDSADFSFKGGIDEVTASRRGPKKALTEEQLARKAELNEERRVRAARMKREHLAATQRAIREGKGAKAKRDTKLQEQRERRVAKRKMGGDLAPGMVRISIKRGGNLVSWGNDTDYLQH